MEDEVEIAKMEDAVEHAWIEQRGALFHVIKVWDRYEVKNEIDLDAAIDELAEAHLKLRNKQASAARFSSK
jgi:hypothetical protein